MKSTNQFLRHRLFNPIREHFGFADNQATNIFPLLHSNHLLVKSRNRYDDYEGRKALDADDHPLPVVGSRLNEMTQVHHVGHFDTFINPMLIQSVRDLKPSEEYVGLRSGYLMRHIGWMKIGGSWKYSRSFNDRRNQYAVGQWQERKMTPRFMLAPRVSPSGPRVRYEGKLQYSAVSLAKIVWAIDTGRLNPNEVITAYHLLHSNVVAKFECVWPGLSLIANGVEKLHYPIHLELQSGTPRAIRLVEEAGGSFTAGYLTGEGMLQELEPEKFPVFPDQNFPQRNHMERVAANPVRRGYLSRWYEEEGKYAHPDAGRRMAHYVRPPQPRDFPANVDEYEAVKHQQKWHLNQPGTGTVLPWHTMNTTDLQRRSTGNVSP